MAFFINNDFKPLYLALFLLVVCILTPLSAQPSGMMMMSPDNDLRAQFSRNQGVFALDMYNLLTKEQPGKNVIFSPLSIQTCTAMVRMGATGETAAEIDKGLGFVSNDAATIAQMFNTVLSDYENSNLLKIANRIYVMRGYNIKPSFHDLVTKKFYAGVENMDFAKGAESASAINSWVESKTNNLIKNLVDASMFSAMTRMVLVNAIHFKGEWEKEFKEYSTHDADFYLNEQDKVKVRMMSQKDRFMYADLPDLDATALEMRYKNSDLSMVIILPNSKTGLKALESKLKNVPLQDIMKHMSSHEVIVKVPKFKAEFSAELTKNFKDLGISRMFEGNAEFGEILDSDESLFVSAIIHKAFIEVNEAGTEAAAATAMVGNFIRPGPPQMPYEFIADKPFYYVIKSSKDSILFAGNFVNS